MNQLGIIVSVDESSNSGILENQFGVQFFFFGKDCFESSIPQRGTIVTFQRDHAFRNTMVAELIEECSEVVKSA